ncbi:MAG: hypothetical protein DLM50_00135 [Candidatus Meridianibacter frigidus]|nr:MAG: hypothetical protein DLM50_00135 [Candidatus Eremiobacteraeota bacterium]
MSAPSTIAIKTPLGIPLLVSANDDCIVASRFSHQRTKLSHSTSLLAEVRSQVRAYFAGNLMRFDVPLAFESGSEIERRIWAAVAEVPFGIFVAYGEIGRAVGLANGHRQVARAMGNAPLDLFIPAHRVVAADGRLRGCDERSVRARLASFERATPCARPRAE